MTSILSSVVFVKTASDEKVCTGTMYRRVKNEELSETSINAIDRLGEQQGQSTNVDGEDLSVETGDNVEVRDIDCGSDEEAS
ncbi:14363_t:CDS:2 [Entrophospora sp. SA101]|nr:14363_t:CDS:2 [Entrophospora sp. SA101]CAJ0823803.1 5418_t:CDS:2 [Entrophospora sp. SA101]